MAGFSDGIKVCCLCLEIVLYYAQFEYNKQGRLKTALVYNKVFS